MLPPGSPFAPGSCVGRYTEKRRGNERLKKLRTFVLGRLIVMTQLAAAIKSKCATENLFRVNQNLRPAVTTV
jgi:hypothetical protein